ncbi:MAG: hypothetical protein IID31_04810 [Planctomycetes bacterium]|nr:hypothetical protein [Planctomycetota bacterium]
MVNKGTESTFSSRRPTICKLAGAFAALSTAVSVHGQTVLYVDDDAPPGGNGRSWSEAISDLQDALWLASFVQDDIEIRIADGVYTPDRGTGLREATFMIDGNSVGSGMIGGLGLSIKGGFAGIKALLPNERDTARFKTVLSGDLNGDDQSGFVNYDDNSHRIMDISDARNTIIELDGLLFRGANGENQSGGALKLRNANVNIRECYFVANRAARGGAIAIFGGEEEISRCFFGKNMASNYGGAIIACGDVSISNSVFSANISTGKGGALVNDGLIEVSECTFYANTATSEGGAYYHDDGAASFSNSIFYLNSPEQLIPNPASGVSVSYSDVQNGYPGVGNINRDPLFTNPLGKDGILGTPDDNFLPRFGSPVIDAGSNDAVYNSLNSDYAGQPRIVDDRFTPDTGAGTAPIVDMGAYEFQTPVCYADCDTSTGVGELDIFDFLCFQHLFVLNDPYACQVDRSTGPNHCDIFDFLAFQSEYIAGCP